MSPDQKFTPAAYLLRARISSYVSHVIKLLKWEEHWKKGGNKDPDLKFDSSGYKGIYFSEQSIIFLFCTNNENWRIPPHKIKGWDIVLVSSENENKLIDLRSTMEIVAA